MSNIYNIGIAFIYTFVKDENVKLSFSLNIIVTIIFNKLIGNLGTFMYETFNESFFFVNFIVFLINLLFIIGLIFIYRENSE